MKCILFIEVIYNLRLNIFKLNVIILVQDHSQMLLKYRMKYDWHNMIKVITRTASTSQRGLNRWSNNSEQKLGFLSKVKIKINAFNKK